MREIHCAPNQPPPGAALPAVDTGPISPDPPVEHRWEISRGRFRHYAKLAISQDAPGTPLSATMAPLEATLHGWGGSLGYLYAAWTRNGLEKKLQRHERRQGFIGKRVEI